MFRPKRYQIRLELTCIHPFEWWSVSNPEELTTLNVLDTWCWSYIVACRGRTYRLTRYWARKVILLRFLEHPPTFESLFHWLERVDTMSSQIMVNLGRFWRAVVMCSHKKTTETQDTIMIQCKHYLLMPFHQHHLLTAFQRFYSLMGFYHQSEACFCECIILLFISTSTNFK